MIEGEDRELFARTLQYATDSHTGSALDTALEELGWHDALSVDARVAVSLLFAFQGAANATSSALDHVLADALGRDAEAVVLPALGQQEAPATLDESRLVVNGVGTASVAATATALVVARAGESHIACEVETGSFTPRPVSGMDPSLGLIELGGDAVDAAPLGPVDWWAAVTVGQLALGHELVGASRRMLELARDHALDRVQFGQPIAKFQAVRIRLAETLVAIEAADAALDAAWQDPGPQTAAMAKATAGRGARVAARHCQQVLAGIGFTTEHQLHSYVKRVLVLEQLLGGTQTLTRQLGRQILEEQHLPDPLPL